MPRDARRIAILFPVVLGLVMAAGSRTGRAELGTGAGPETPPGPDTALQVPALEGPLLLPIEPQAAEPADAGAARESGQSDTAADQAPARPEREEAAEPEQSEQQPAQEDAVEEKPAQEEAAGDTAAEDKPLEGKASGDEAAKQEEPAAPKQLSPAMAALRDRVRRTLAQYAAQPLSARTNMAGEILDACLAFGCRTEVFRSDAPAQKINGITCLCWNYPCAGYEPLCLSQGRVAPRTGYGLQQRPGQFLAVMGVSKVPVTYPVRVGEDVRTLADVVEHEKQSCRSGVDQSLRLVGLAYYAGSDPWHNDLGQQWSIDRLVEEETARPIADQQEAGLDRLLGLSCAVAVRKDRKEPLGAGFERAAQYVARYHEFALEIQNADGTWGPALMAGPSASRDAGVQLSATGRVLEWLAVSLPDEKLEDAGPARAVDAVDRLLTAARHRFNPASASAQEITSVMHALHALGIYDQRVFRPADVKQPAADDAAPAPAGGN